MQRAEKVEVPELVENLGIENTRDWEDSDWEDELNPQGSGQPESELETQIRKCKQLENKLRSLQITYELNKKNTAKLIKDNQTVLKDKIREYKKTISEQNTLIGKCKKALRQRNARLTELEDQVAELTEELEHRSHGLMSAAHEAAPTPPAPEKKQEEEAKEETDRLGEIAREYEAKIEALNQQKMLLHRAGEYYRSLFTCSAEAMLIIDPQSRRIEQSNQAAAKLFGMKNPEDLNGNTIDSLSPTRQPNNTISLVKLKDRLQEAVENGSVVFDHRFTIDGGNDLDTIVSLGTIESSQADDLIAVVHDVTELRKKGDAPPEELLEARKELEAAWEISRQNSGILKQINKAIQASLTPVLKTARSLAEEQGLSDKHWQKLDEISSNSRYLISMIQYLSSLGSIADGSLAVEESEFNLYDFINELDKIYSQKAEAKKLFFAVSFAQQKSEHKVPAQIISDHDKIEFILKTLLTYAVRNTDKGRFGLHARREANPSGDEKVDVVFELAFTGSARTSDQVLKKVFEPTDETGSAFDPDLDFELALTRQYARLLGGDINLEFRPGGITSLIFSFLCTEKGADEPEGKNAPKKEANPNPSVKEESAAPETPAETETA